MQPLLSYVITLDNNRSKRVFRARRTYVREVEDGKMDRRAKLQLAIFAGVLSWLVSSPSGAAEPRPNVLLIAVDDLRAELGCYGSAHVHSPNIDALAASGRLFQRAYCQQAVCNPSRTSLMTGMRPDSIGVTGNHSHFRTNHPSVVTLPQHFKKHGYHAAAIGKIYHGVFPAGASKTKWDTMGDPESWSAPAIRFGPRYYYTEEGIAAAKLVYERIYKPHSPGPDDWTRKLVFGPATESPDVPDSTLYDGQVADAAIKTLRQLKDKGKPFFLAVGFIKPHSPYIAPKKYFDRYQDVALPSHTQFPVNAPQYAGHGSGELRRYTDQPRRDAIPKENQRRVRHAYYACISYIDAQVGRVLNELDRSGLRDNTIVVLYGDHGYHLGEHGLWGKTTNFELDTRVPLIVRAPGMKSPGNASSSLVELVDLYPTLAELADLPINEQLEGASFAAILDDANHVTKTFALSQYPRGGGLMGYTMRTATHRLTQWVHRQTGEIRATELYNYTDGPVESENVASTSTELVGKLSLQLVSALGLAQDQAASRAGNGPQSDAASAVAGFEKARAGRFDELDSTIGKWTPVDGRTIIDDKHSKSGKQCLQLTGGHKTSVLLELADGVDTTGNLVFWAERWTKRAPFSFRIEKNSGGGWKEIFNGDQEVRVGRSFLSQVKVPLGDDAIKQLRFTVTSVPNTGILIDDIRIAPARPQKIVSVEVVALTLPALVGNDASPLLKLKIETTGQLNPLSLTELQGELKGDEVDILSVQAYYESNSRFSSARMFGKPLGAARFAKDPKGRPRDRGLADSAAKKLKFSGRQALGEGSNYVWIACKLNASANIDHQPGAVCEQVTFSNGQTIRLNAAPSYQRLGVAVRNRGDDGVNTYRIPGLATTNKGTLIGVYDVRRRSGGDLPGDIDVGMSRSVNGGRTWEPMRVIMDMGDDPDFRYDGIGDPAVLVDRNTGAIWVAATWSHGNRSWRGSGQGMKPEETGQLMLVRSDDDGATWSKPINITEQVKRPEWCFILQGPGKGITMRDGTIVFAAQYQDPPEQRRLPHSTIIYSRDHGKTWQVGTGAFDDTTESQVVEVEPGVLMLNCRYNRKSVRVVMTTRDMGKTWQKHETSERSLIEPGSCMASLIDVDNEVGKNVGNWLLFSNPDSSRGRHHLTVKASPDRGMTWPKEHRLLLDEGNSAGYSCMSMIDEKTVGILYEGSRVHMTFQRIPLVDLIGSEADGESPKRAPQPAGSQTARPADEGHRRALSLPQVFGSHMVLQAGAVIPVWGRASPAKEVHVTFGGDSQVVKADRRGDWRLQMPACTATSTPRNLLIESAGERIQFTDVLVGEVWVCAGQSNMEWMLAQSASGGDELAAADHAEIRLLNLPGGARGSSGSYAPMHLARLTPETFCEGEWKVASAESARSFSAVAWYFGRRLQAELKVPVGLICPAAGGTPTESWIPVDALADDPELKELVFGNWLDNERLGEFCRVRGQQNLLAAIQAGEPVPADRHGPNHSFKPGFMWSAGIEPLIPYAIRGVIWYQGESNAETPGRVREHGRLFPLLINQWRDRWGQGDFPFLYVQLPALNRSEWPWFRAGQRRSLSQLSNVGMAITIDTGHPSNVHPTSKKPVGQRLAKWALGTTYELKTHAIFSGPLLEVAEREGDSMVVSFKHVGEGLKSSDERPLRHFEICGDNGVFHPGTAEIISKSSVAVSSPLVAEPRDVRYGWLPFPNPPVNLFNSANLPASPFSSEDEKTLFARRKQNLDRGANSGNRPNILLIVSEDNGPELGCYGDKYARTPNLDQLAADGVRFETAYVTQSIPFDDLSD